MKERVKKGETYYYIDFGTIAIRQCVFVGDVADELRIKNNNIFKSNTEAESMARKLRAVLAGADVIKMPSEEEMREAKPTFSIDYDPYCAEEVRRGFEMCYYWLKYKIVK